jgi:WD40 repeat protein
VYCVIISPEFSPGCAAAVRIWDLATGQLRHSLDPDVGTRSVCAFSADDGRTLLAAAGIDAIVRILDPANGQLERSLEGSTGKVWNVCAFSAGWSSRYQPACSPSKSIRKTHQAVDRPALGRSPRSSESAATACGARIRHASVTSSASLSRSTSDSLSRTRGQPS